MILKLYRGISVNPKDAEITLNSIRANGLVGDEGQWKFTVPDVLKVRQRIEEIVNAENPSVDEFLDNTPFKGICACGDENSGGYYALKHNKSNDKSISIIISFKASIDRIYVDCRDFLCTAFQLWDSTTTEIIEKQKAILIDLFGEGILRYFDRCISSSDQELRIAMCNIASFDRNVVMDHYKNRNVIGGRHHTRFSSAFFVQGPIVASDIENCKHLEDYFTNPQVFTDLDIFLGRI